MAKDEKVPKAEEERRDAEQEALDASDEARENLMGPPVEVEFLEDAVLPTGEKVAKGEIAELPHEQARQVVQTGRAKFNEGDTTGQKKATTGKGRRSKGRK